MTADKYVKKAGKNNENMLLSDLVNAIVMSYL
jgi:hypothetical protein